MADTKRKRPPAIWGKGPVYDAAVAEWMHNVDEGMAPMDAGLLMSWELHTGSGPYAPRVTRGTRDKPPRRSGS